MKCSTIGKFLVTICKNPIDVFFNSPLVKVCDVRHVAPSFFWWSTPLFLAVCSHCSPFFSTEKIKNTFLAREFYRQKCKHQPFGARWKVLVRCHCVPSAIGSSRSDEIRIERRRTPRRGRQTAARSQKQIPGPESRWWSLWSWGFFAVKVKCEGKWSQSIKESVVDIWFVDKLRSIEFDRVVIQILTPLMGNSIFLGGNPSRHLPRAFAIRMYSADSSMPFQICTHSSRQRQACPLWWSDFFVVFWTKKRRQL